MAAFSFNLRQCINSFTSPTEVKVVSVPKITPPKFFATHNLCGSEISSDCYLALQYGYYMGTTGVTRFPPILNDSS